MTENTAVLASYGLSKTYGACKALDGLNLMVRRGDIYGLVGRNGAGKTTFMRMATGQSTPTGGELELFGASGKDLRAQRSRTGAMIEIPSFSPSSSPPGRTWSTTASSGAYPAGRRWTRCWSWWI